MYVCIDICFNYSSDFRKPKSFLDIYSQILAAGFELIIVS